MNCLAPSTLPLKRLCWKFSYQSFIVSVWVFSKYLFITVCLWITPHRAASRSPHRWWGSCQEIRQWNKIGWEMVGSGTNVSGILLQGSKYKLNKHGTFKFHLTSDKTLSNTIFTVNVGLPLYSEHGSLWYLTHSRCYVVALRWVD